MSEIPISREVSIEFTHLNDIEGGNGTNMYIVVKPENTRYHSNHSFLRLVTEYLPERNFGPT